VASSSVPAGQIFGPVPEITCRLGIDRHPVDLADPGARSWLEAFVWPEHTGDLAVLRGAIDLAISAAAVTVVQGDATTDTARLVGELPGRELAVVFTATLLSYLTAGARTALTAQLRQAGWPSATRCFWSGQPARPRAPRRRPACSGRPVPALDRPSPGRDRRLPVAVGERGRRLTVPSRRT